MNNTSGLYMPAEWEKHERTFISWPVQASLVWPENYKEVCEGYSNVIRAISQFEPVSVIAGPQDRELAESYCGSAAQYVEIPHNDAWFRDNGPTFVFDRESGKRKGIHWRFNAWGERYKPYDLDAKTAAALLSCLDMEAVGLPLVLEGGSIHTDGQGTLLTTGQCLLNPNRNPDLSKEQISGFLRENLGVSQIIWLKDGLDGDETDGHIDNVACFAAPGIVLLQTCHDPSDPNYAVTKQHLDLLGNASDARGRKLKIIEIPQPPFRSYTGKRLTLSYLNFYMVNGGIILPVFGGDASETDAQAASILSETFPGRDIITVDGIPLVKEGGNVHCITQQMPAECGLQCK